MSRHCTVPAIHTRRPSGEERLPVEFCHEVVLQRNRTRLKAPLCGRIRMSGGLRTRASHVANGSTAITRNQPECLASGSSDSTG